MDKANKAKELFNNMFNEVKANNSKQAYPSYQQEEKNKQ